MTASKNAEDARIATMIGARDVDGVRAEFPLLNRMFDAVHLDAGGPRPFAYLDNAATTQKPEKVLDAVNRFYRESNANVHRGIHRLAAEATELYENAREEVRAFINAESSREIVFTRGTTESINLVASAWGGGMLTEGDEIILTEMEHHSNLVPWQMVAGARGATLRFVPFDERGELDLGEYERMFSDRVRIVAVNHMSNVFGTINDVRAMVRIAHSHGVPVLVDGAQSVPHMPVDVRTLGCDFLAFSGHKMCGPTGIGVLYGKEEWLERMQPYMGGGEMISAVWLDRATWNELPYKFEAGTPNIAGAVGLGAAVQYLDDIGRASIAAYERQLTDYALSELAAVDGLRLYGRARERGAVISFNLDGVHAHDVAQILDRELVAVRAGHHCANPLMRKLNVPATVRASLYFYNNRDDIDRLVVGLSKTTRFFRNGV